MKILYIALQRLGNYAVALAAHVGIASGRRESHRISDGIIRHIPRQRDQVVKPDTGHDLRKYYLHNVVDHGEVRLFHLIKAELDNQPLALGPGKIRIHFAQSGIGHCLDAVQVIQPGLL